MPQFPQSAKQRQQYLLHRAIVKIKWMNTCEVLRTGPCAELGALSAGYRLSNTMHPKQAGTSEKSKAKSHTAAVTTIKLFQWKVIVPSLPRSMDSACACTCILQGRHRRRKDKQGLNPHGMPLQNQVSMNRNWTVKRIFSKDSHLPKNRIPSTWATKSNFWKGARPQMTEI